MTQISKADRARLRAARLRTEARNCLWIALSAGDPAFAAALIDEAALLTRRSGELAA